MAFDLTHARHAPNLCLAPGLFRSFMKKERQKQKLDVTYWHGAAECLRFIGFEPLGADDMRLLQVLVALAGPSGMILSADPSASLAKTLRSLMAPQHSAVDHDGLAIHTRITKLIAESGLTNGGGQCESGKGLVGASIKCHGDYHQGLHASEPPSDESCL